MTKTSKEVKRILRKTLKNNRTLKKIKRKHYNVFDEHNYFMDFKKLCILKNSIEFNDIKIINNKNNINEKCDTLPDWLKDYNSSSEEEGDVGDRSLSHLLIMEYKKDSANSFKVCPPFDWVHLIYLTVKNFPKEYVTYHDIHTFSRNWFPYYINNSWINSIISTLNCPSNTYFKNSSSTLVGDCVKWTVNIESVNFLEESLMSIVKKYEKEIKSAMKYPDKLTTILKGYGVHYLGYINVLQKSKSIKSPPKICHL